MLYTVSRRRCVCVCVCVCVVVQLVLLYSGSVSGSDESHTDLGSDAGRCVMCVVIFQRRVSDGLSACCLLCWLCVMEFVVIILAVMLKSSVWSEATAADPPDPPLDVESEALNCTSIRVQWRISWTHMNTVTGYRVTCSQLKRRRAGEHSVTVNVPVSLDAVSAVQMNGYTHLNTVIGGLKMGTEYSVSVQSYGWTGVGRPGGKRIVETLSHDTCKQPVSPTRLQAFPVSDTEIVLSWQPGGGESGSGLHHFLVSYVRAGLESEWSTVQVSAQTTSMILRGLSPETPYTFQVRAVDVSGETFPGPISSPVWTLSAQRAGGGRVEVLQYLSDSQSNDEDLSADDDDALTPRTHVTLMKSVTKPPESKFGLNDNNPAPSKRVAQTSHARIPPSPSSSSSTSAPAVSPHAPVARWRGAVRQLSDLLCEDAVCPPDSLCIDDFSSGGSRCHCVLGRGGETCSHVVDVKFPKFFGSSHLTFEPLKNSYQTFEITLEFKTDTEDGLLLYCGEDQQGEGDFASLALIRGKLHFRYNCGTGAAHIVSKRRVNVGQWNRVTVSREGLSGWLRLNNDTPVTGRSQGSYMKITFRTPLYVGGSPGVYWLAKAAGTNRGFHGCVQTLSVNGQVIDMRPWPRGRALSGADVGEGSECSEGACVNVTCENGGVCFAGRADGFICLCPFGYRGPVCQDGFLPIMPFFSETLQSYVSVPWPLSSRHYLSFMEFEMVFRPVAYDGTLMYSEDTESRDFLSVTLVDGHVEFRFDCGSGVAVIRSEEAVSLHRWHDLLLTRSSRRGILQLDTQTPVLVLAEGAFTQVRCNTALYFGGVPDYEHTKSGSGVKVPFTGSIQQVRLNNHDIQLAGGSVTGVNVQESEHPCAENPCVNGGICKAKHEQYKCDCPLEDRQCHTADTRSVPQFTGRSYLTYDNTDVLKRVSGFRTHILMRFRSSAPDGLLLWRGDGPQLPTSDFISLTLQDGAVVMRFNLGSGTASLAVNGSFSDGSWHWVKASREGEVGRLRVDDSDITVEKSAGRMRQLNTSGPLYIGGVKETSPHKHHLRGLVGCISHLTLSTDYHISPVDEASDGKNIGACLH